MESDFRNRNLHDPTRRAALQNIAGLSAIGIGGLLTKSLSPKSFSPPAQENATWTKTCEKALQWLIKQQNRLGNWPHSSYPVAVTALAGTALICSGSTTTQGPYAKNIRNCVDYLLSKCRKNGLIGDPRRDQRYTYGHGFAMLFLSQVLGEEEDVDRRAELVEVLERSVRFSVDAQTKAGGWGYVSGKESDFDEGSTTITQVQGLRGCRNAGIVVPAKAIEEAKKYIYVCQNRDGGISYSSSTKGSSRPAITAAALAALYNAGDYESKKIPPMWAYCKKNLHNIQAGGYGHWHYTYLYYTQVVYRQGPDVWKPYRDKLYARFVGTQSKDGYWEGGNVGKVYTTAINLIMMQLDYGYLPIYQR
jgi:hypothetical protein